MSIITQLKSNTSAFGLMDNEMQRVAMVIGKRNFSFYTGEEVGWLKAQGVLDNFSEGHLVNAYRLDANYQCNHPETENLFPRPIFGSGVVCKWCGTEIEPPKPKMGWVGYPIKMVDDYYAVEINGQNLALNRAMVRIGFGGISYEAPSRNGVTTSFMMFPTEGCDEKLGPWTPVKIRFYEELK